MGSDNLHHRRKQKSLKDLQRKQARKSAYKTVLIVCEGSKTEPQYFRDLISELRLNVANVRVLPSISTCPLDLVKYARSQADTEDFDEVYCVFDRDRHTKYSDALQLLSSLGSKFFAINSVPCFEYWLLLHFEASSPAFYGNASKSAGDEAVSRLRKRIPEYEKGQEGVYFLLRNKLENALKNSEIANKSAFRANTDNPTTQVSVLVHNLFKIRAEMDH